MGCRQCSPDVWVCGDVECPEAFQRALNLDFDLGNTLFGEWESKGGATIRGFDVEVFTRAWRDPGEGKIQTAVKIVVTGT
jgi:hypothetical protein